MKEDDIINAIQQTLHSKYIGDDCACLRDLGIVVTQDSLVEDIHFKRNLITPYQLGYKSIAVNMSDIYASGADPTYLTLAASFPNDITKPYILEFMNGCKDAANPAQIVGGDVTGSDKIYISVSAIGRLNGKHISSRSNAKVGYKIVTSGEHGSSGAGLYMLVHKMLTPQKFIEKHLMPRPAHKFSYEISSKICDDYAMMDTSDGLMDALLKVAQASNVKMCIDFDKVPYDKELEYLFPESYTNFIFFGGEDYQLIAAVPEYMLNNISDCHVIGEVKEKAPDDDYVEINYGDRVEKYSSANDRIFSHFGQGAELEDTI
ncbi:thiamine-phosphate kinase [bacterium]|nr:thiamine-phosphate kinase [bacterium]